MDASPISMKMAQKTPIEDLMQQLDTTAQGLSNEFDRLGVFDRLS